MNKYNRQLSLIMLLVEGFCSMRLKVFFLTSFLLILFTISNMAQEGNFLGVIDDETPFREYPLTVAITGSTVTIDMRRLDGDAGGDLDTLLYLVDSNGNIVAANDDRELNVDSNSLLIYPQAIAGQYRIIATRYNVQDGTTSGRFNIVLDIAEPEEDIEYGVQQGDLLNTGFPINQEVAAKADWTVLAYYGGDNNLEQSILNDLKEFENAGGSDDTVRVIALVDRSPAYSTANGDWSGARLFEVSASINPEFGENLIIDSTILAEFPNFDSSNGELFAQFLVWSIQKYPADNYVVALASHGAGWQGIIQDDTTKAENPEDIALVTLPELQQAFRVATQAANLPKFALLINDACSMSSIEYFSEVGKFFNYSLASPEIVIDPALDMTLFDESLDGSAENPNFTEIGRLLVNKYIDIDMQARASADNVYLTHAVTDLDLFNDVEAAVEEFARVINANPSTRTSVLGTARTNTYTYTHFYGNTDKIDLGNFMRYVIVNTRDSEVIDAAETVLNALDSAKLYGSSGATVSQYTSYYNIYFPEESKDFNQGYFDQTPLKEWSRMLRNYFNSFTPQRWAGAGGVLFHAPSAPQLKIISQISTEVSIVNPATIGLEYTGRNISNGFTTVDQIQPDGSAIRYISEPIWSYRVNENGVLEHFNEWTQGVNQSSVSWDAAIPILTDGTNSSIELINYTDDVTYLDGRYREQGATQWNDVTVAFDLEGNYLRVLNRATGSNALAIIEIPVGSEFQAYLSVVSPDGRVFNEPGNVYTWQSYGLRWSRQPAPNGEYSIGLLLSALGGVTGFASTEVTVNNTGINPNLRGYTDSFLGYTVPYLTDWGTWGSFGDLSYRTAKTDATENFTIYLAPRMATTNLIDIANALAEQNNLIITSSFIRTEVDGYPVVQFDYTYTVSSGRYKGRMFVYLYEPFSLGYGFAAEVKANVDNAVLNANYRDLFSGTSMFDILEFEATQTNEWYGSNITDETSYLACFRARNDWEVSTDANDWTRFTSPLQASTFIATKTVNADSEIEGTTDGNLSSFTTGIVSEGATNFTLLANQIYFAPTDSATSLTNPNEVGIQWSVTLYETTRDNVDVMGRVYVVVQDGLTYAIWMEAPISTDASSVFTDTFEPFVNSYRIKAVGDFC
jgi:hypothetical protein